MEGNKKSLYTFSFKSIIFLSILLLILKLFLLPYVNEVGSDGKYKFALYRNRHMTDSLDIVFFGNSYSFTAYDPSIIRNRLGLKSLHINSGAQRLYTTLIVAKSIIEKSNYKYLFFDISDQTLVNPKVNEEKIWYYQTVALQDIPFSFDKTLDVIKYFPRKEYPEYFISSLDKDMGKIFRLNTEFKDYKKETDTSYFSNGPSVLFSLNGFLAKSHYSITRESFLRQIQRKPSSRLNDSILWSEDLKKLMIQICDLAKNRQEEVILVNSLKLNTYVYKDNFIDWLTKEYENVRILNLNSVRKDYYLTENDFYNSTHLNYQGSYKVTNRLIDSLSKWYSIPVKKGKIFNFGTFNLKDWFYKLNNNQDKFIKLEFDSVPKILNNYQLVVSLYPRDTSLLSDYSKRKGFGSDNFYIKNPCKSSIDVHNSQLLIKRLNTNITSNSLEKIKIYFYRQNDTLKIPSFIISNSFE